MGSGSKFLMKRLGFSFFFILLLTVAAVPLQAAGQGFDHSLWDAFLKKYVNEKGEVNYAAVKQDPSMLNDYLNLFSTEAPDGFGVSWPREEMLAFWMNVYNAGVIKLIVEHYPVKNIQQIPSVWDISAIHIGDKMQVSLNEIRMQRLIGAYRDEKIHLALSCGAEGCPKLQRQAFTGANVEGQLFLATRAFLRDPQNVEIIPGKKKIKLSRIFKWYGYDFNLDFGTPERIGKFSNEEMSVLSFLAYYLENEDQIAFLEEGHYKIYYFPFDWTLNDWKADAPSAVAK